MTPEGYFYTNKDLRILFVPLLIEMALAFGVGLADSMMVAQISEAAVSGVSLVDFIMALLLNVFAALAGGGAVIVGQYYGMRDTENCRHSARQMVRCVLAFSLCVTVLIYVGRDFILGTLYGDIAPDVREAAEIYFNIVVLSVPFMALYNCGAAVFRTMGNSRLPMTVMMLMNILNIIGNAVLVFALKWGVEGIALPTLCARFGAAAIVLYLSQAPALEINTSGWWKAKNDFPMMRRILGIGLPFSFENGMFSLGRIAVLSIVARFGTAAIAANAVSNSIGVIQTMPGAAINMGLSVIIARSIGAHDPDQARYYTKKILTLMHGFFLISASSVILAMPLLMKVYDLSPEAERMAWWVVVSHGVLQVMMWPEAFSLPVVFRAAGDARYPMVVAIAIMIFARIASAWVFAVTLGMGMLGTWWAMYFDWMVRICFFVPHYIRGKWLNHRAI